MCDVIYPTMQHYTKTTLQPLHHQPTSLTYGGAQAMDVTGGDKTWVPSKGKAPQRVIVKRSIGQLDRACIHLETEVVLNKKTYTFSKRMTPSLQKILPTQCHLPRTKISCNSSPLDERKT